MPIEKDESEWKKELTPEQYRVLRECGTDPAFTGEFVDYDEAGIYVCGACKTPLFASETKFHSDSGWPSFYDVAKEGAVKLIEDSSHGMHRIEVKCANCDSHLGHVFDDAPQTPTGQRFCINSSALGFRKSDEVTE